MTKMRGKWNGFERNERKRNYPFSVGRSFRRKSSASCSSIAPWCHQPKPIDSVPNQGGRVSYALPAPGSIDFADLSGLIGLSGRRRLVRSLVK